MRPLLHTETNPGAVFNLQAVSMTLSNLTQQFSLLTSLSSHSSHSCSLFSLYLASLLFLFFVSSALFHSHLVTLAQLQSTHPDCCFLPLPPHPATSLRLQLVCSLLCSLLISSPFHWVFSQPAPMTPSLSTVFIPLFPSTSLSRGFFDIFSSIVFPLSLIPHLHQHPSHLLSLAPLCFPSLFCAICSFFIP